MGFTYIQGTGNSAESVASLDAAFADPVQAGRLIVVTISAWALDPIIDFTVTDLQDNTYTRAEFNTGTRRSLAIYYSVIAVGDSPFTVVVTPGSPASRLGMAIDEYSFTGSGVTKDTSSTGDGTSAIASAGTLDLASPGELVVVGAVSEISSATAPGAGYTLGYVGGASEKLSTEYRTGASGTVDTEMTMDVSAQWTAAAVAFLSPGSPTPTPTPTPDPTATPIVIDPDRASLIIT